jgi:hypothetical protein
LYSADRSFSGELDQIKNCREQLDLMESVLGDQWKAVLFSFGLGVLALVLLILGLFEVLNWWLVALGVLVLMGFLLKPMRRLEKSVLTAKEQDRKYILECMRSANNMDELHQAGLFGYVSGDTEEACEKKYREIQTRLAAALATEASDDL